jgi:hypothetical protein
MAPLLPPAGERTGSLRVMTNRLSGGLLRKNGVPYSDQAQMTEFWDLNSDDTGQSWLTITTQVQDPIYLVGPFTYSSIFQKEQNASMWDPEPCRL